MTVTVMAVLLFANAVVVDSIEAAAKPKKARMTLFANNQRSDRGVQLKSRIPSRKKDLTDIYTVVVACLGAIVCEGLFLAVTCQLLEHMSYCHIESPIIC